MIGIGVLVALGRRFLAATLADTGFLPARYYRHLVLEALEAEDFHKALTWLAFSQDPVLGQILVLRLRLLSARHAEQRRAVQELLDADPPEHLRPRGLALLTAEDQALALLSRYEGEAMNILRHMPGNQGSPAPP